MRDYKIFPKVTGSNLNKTTMNIPEDLGGEYNLVIVAFQQRQQYDVNTWISFLDALSSNNSDFEYYELPTIRSMNRFYQRIIDGGMRAGIPSIDTREHTITLYIDKKRFQTALEIENEDDIHLYLVDRIGKVYGEWVGPYNEQAATELAEILTEVRISSKDL